MSDASQIPGSHAQTQKLNFVDAGNSNGSFIRNEHLIRAVKIYPITDVELDALSEYGKGQRLWSAIATFIGAFVCERVWTTYIVADEKTPPTQAAVWTIRIGWTVVTLCMLMALSFGWKRRQIISNFAADKKSPLLDEGISLISDCCRAAIKRTREKFGV